MDTKARRLLGISVLIGIIIVAALILLLTPVVFHKPAVAPPASSVSAKDNPVDPGTNLGGAPAPNFTLTDQYGQTVSLSQFKGKVVVLAFVDSECTTICPLTTQGMMDSLNMLGPEAAKHIQFLGIDANPEAIAVTNVKQYSVDHRMMNSWHFLTGSLSQLKTVWHNYDIYTQIVNDQIDHTPALYIIDPQGREQVLFMTPSQYASVAPQSAVIAQQIARFLPNDVHTTVKNVKYQPPQIDPAGSIQVQTISLQGQSGTMTIGPGRPQLVMFFASWAPNLQGELEALNKYASQPGAPQVIAVDEATVEPNDQAVESILKKLPNLKFKVGIDHTGEIADAYHAADIPWFSLTDGKGNIIWSQDAWTSTSKLEKAVAKKLSGLQS